MNNKDKYGEVLTPPLFVEQMMDDAINVGNLKLDDITIFEPGAGKGVFFDVMQNKKALLGNNFKYIFNEINGEHEKDLRRVAKTGNTTILMKDLLTLDEQERQKYKADLVVGNLPFNSNSKKFVPSLAVNNKDDKMITQSKSVTIWTKMTHYCFEHIIKPGGYFFAIIPCIWLKPDKQGIYSLFTQQNKLILLKIFDCQTSNKIFKYNCQTPICYVLVKKEDSSSGEEVVPTTTFKLFDKDKYIDFNLEPNLCIPTKMASAFAKYSGIMNKYNCSSCFTHLRKISTLKQKCLDEEVTRFPKGGLEFYKDNISGVHKIITGSIYNKQDDVLTLNGFVSKEPALYDGVPKLILPHKRRAKFFKDYTGEYSCFGRDMYIFICSGPEQIDKLYDFFTNNLCVNKMIESGFTIRMNFIEKYVFQYIPWIFDENYHYVEKEAVAITHAE